MSRLMEAAAKDLLQGLDHVLRPPALNLRLGSR